MEADSVVRKAMGAPSILIQRAAGGMFVQHPASEVDSRRSIYSGPWYHLKVDEWYSSDVTLQVKAHDSTIDVQEEDLEENPWETRFHGTVFKAFLSVIKDGGLVAGPNGHHYKGKTLLGMFCCKSLSEAFLRVAPGRGIPPSKPGAGLDLGCMPVVVELSAVLLEKVPPASEGRAGGARHAWLLRDRREGDKTPPQQAVLRELLPAGADGKPRGAQWGLRQWLRKFHHVRVPSDRRVCLSKHELCARRVVQVIVARARLLPQLRWLHLQIRRPPLAGYRATSGCLG
jgi:hypothetical protein